MIGPIEFILRILVVLLLFFALVIGTTFVFKATDYLDKKTPIHVNMGRS